MHWFLDPITKHYADFEGRVGRQAFWMFILINFIFSLIASALGDVAGGVYSLAVLLPALAITTRRLHDIDKSGWWQLLWFIPIIGWLILVVWCATKGDVVTNRYGNPAGMPVSPETSNVVPPLPPSNQPPA